MATTTNYGWTTPDDTALVKDGASAIRSLGTSVDTTTKNLNPSTTLGDVEYRSSTANTNTRLGIGSTGQVLTVAGGVPTWATPSGTGQSWTLISTQTASGVAITFSSLSGYNSYMLVLNVVKTNGSGQAGINLTFNGDTAANYTNTGLYFSGGSQDSFASTTGTAINGASFGSSSGNEVNGFFYITGANTANHKVGSQSTAGSGTNRTARSGAIIWRNSATVSSITAEIATDAYLSGSFLLYGSVI